jgi:alpha-methylacyl-CoA racemase
VYETSDARHLAIGPIEAKFYRELLLRLGLDPDKMPGQWEHEQWPEVHAVIADVVRQRSLEEWVLLFEGSDACAAPVLTVDEAASHPHLVARATYIERDGVRQPGPAPRFSRTPGQVGREPCLPGEHTREILSEAGFGADEITNLQTGGIIGVTDGA